MKNITQRRKDAEDTVKGDWVVNPFSSSVSSVPPCEVLGKMKRVKHALASVITF